MAVVTITGTWQNPLAATLPPFPTVLASSATPNVLAAAGFITIELPDKARLSPVGTGVSIPSEPFRVVLNGAGAVSFQVGVAPTYLITEYITGAPIKQYTIQGLISADLNTYTVT